jgi:PDZ domain-containing protein
VVLAALATLVYAVQPSPYYVLTPGGTYDLKQRLTVPDPYGKEMGHLAFTAVFAQGATWGQYVGARLSQNAEIVPADEIRAPGETQEDVNARNQHLIDESKPVAEVVAMRYAGLDARLVGQGAAVRGVLPGLPADGVFQEGDVIVDIDGAPVQTASDAASLLSKRSVGDSVHIGVLRDGERQALALSTAQSPTDPNHAVVGVSLSTVGFEAQTPFTVNVDTDTVGGPSAGFMISLGILDAITDGDLSRGRFVVGTGTMAPDGSIGPIGGAAEKVVAAKLDHADLFFVPRDNLEEANARARGLPVVPVDTLDEAVRYLCDLPSLPARPTSAPPLCSRFNQ